MYIHVVTELGIKQMHVILDVMEIPVKKHVLPQQNNATAVSYKPAIHQEPPGQVHPVHMDVPSQTELPHAKSLFVRHLSATMNAQQKSKEILDSVLREYVNVLLHWLMEVRVQVIINALQVTA